MTSSVLLVISDKQLSWLYQLKQKFFFQIAAQPSIFLTKIASWPNVTRSTESQPMPFLSWQVFEAEKMVTRIGCYHKNCFSCIECSRKLDSMTCCEGKRLPPGYFIYLFENRYTSRWSSIARGAITSISTQGCYFCLHSNFWLRWHRTNFEYWAITKNVLR